MGAKILLVGRNPTNLALMTQVLKKAGYDSVSATTLDAMDAAIAGPVDLALIDVTGFESQLWERCAELQRQGVPFVLLSPRPVTSEVAGEAGGYPVMGKPLTMQAFLNTVSAMLGEGA